MNRSMDRSRLCSYGIHRIPPILCYMKPLTFDAAIQQCEESQQLKKTILKLRQDQKGRLPLPAGHYMKYIHEVFMVHALL